MLEVSSSTSAVVQGVLIALVIGSVFTWVLILIKAYQVWLIRRQNVKFRGAFWAAPDLNAASKLEGHAGPTYRVAQVGFHALKEFDASSGNGGDLQHSGDRQDVLERALKQQIKKERFIREAGLVVLASIGSTAPFVGLFGTVWGIMHALTDISRLGSASLEVVAGPIGEALIATAIGIAVAVPAVLAYNFFLRRLKTSSDNLDDFAADLIKVSRRVTFQPRIETTGNTAQDANAPVVRNLKGAIA